MPHDKPGVRRTATELAEGVGLVLLLPDVARKPVCHLYLLCSALARRGRFGSLPIWVAT